MSEGQKSTILGIEPVVTKRRAITDIIHRPFDMKDHALPWVGMFRRCRSRFPQIPGVPYWGRCDLKRGHGSMHALERGMEIVKWNAQ